MVYNPYHPPPAPPAFGNGKELPQAKASPLSKLVFGWLTPFLSVGFSRPLEKEDLWSLPNERLSHSLTDAVQNHFYPRCPPEKRPRHMRPESHNDQTASLTPETSADGSNTAATAPAASEPEKHGKLGKTDSAQTQARGKKAPKYDESLMKALHSTFFWRWWAAGFMKLCGDTLNTTTPLVNKLLLTWLTDAFLFHQGVGPKPRGIGYGIGLSFAIFAMQELSSLCTNHYFIITMTNGLCVRTGIIGNIFRKSLRLSGRARLDHSVGQITTMISTDATRLDLSSSYIHNLWVGPIQIIIGVALLINNLGPSALVGLGVLLIGFPIQFILVRVMFRNRRLGVTITDKRVRLTTEVLQGIRLIKAYAWEAFYAHQIGDYRAAEIAKIRKMAIARAGLISVVTLVPIAASVLSFITYALSGHTLSPATIFSSLQFFNVIRAPLIFFPLVLSSVSDAYVALQRIGAFLTAEELEEPYLIEEGSKYAVDVDADFTWETARPHAIAGNKFAHKGKHHSKEGKGDDAAAKKKKEKKKKGVLPTTVDETKPDEEKKEEEKPFVLKDMQLRVPKGSFVAVVGRVGSGKSSLLQGLVGEMRRTRGNVVFGGAVAYVPQSAWIMNATLRENVLFGRENDDVRFAEIVKACSLQQDLDMLPYGDGTEIGEKGINLSGGQKARVSLARAAYSDSDVVLLDDPLSAVDAHVGKAILDECLLDGPLADKTRILVTHALHVLDKTDYIYFMDNGVITEHGTYQSLMQDGQAFSRLLEEYGKQQEEEEEENTDAEKTDKKKDVVKEEKVEGQTQAPLMSEEERNRGAVPLSIYSQYFRHAGGILWAPFIVILLTLTQGASVGNNLFLGYWTADSIHGFKQGDYMAVYAALGFAQAFFSFISSFVFSLVGLYASLKLFKAALSGVLRSPISFFDTTPMGRIMSRLSKDQDTLDTQIAQTSYQLLSTFSNVLGTVALVFYTFPLLGTIFAPLSILYFVVSVFYRRSSVETKRLDSLMRSALYASYSETLTGLATVRAYQEQERFIRNAEHGLDMENRAYFMTVAIQRWLSLRLDFFGNILILGIGLFAAGFRTTVNPSKVGVVLSYSLSITQAFSNMITQFAQNEQNMNAVERVLVYVDLLPEGEFERPDDPPPSWPDKGEIKFRDVELAYRPGLPLVLKGVNFDVKPGEKVGIVGRTGAGKTSLLQALFRMVEISAGKIEIDDIDTKAVGLDTLRHRLALVPQDSTLFLGTLRENLDPQNSRTDAELLSALRRTGLLPAEGTPVDPTTDAKFSLNATVGDEGANYSAGEKQLLSLTRALIKSSRIIVLDEATSSVDFETDAKLQRTIQTEFAQRTLLCIAHRLNTIVYYDRILVMDAGQVAEFDTPLNLYDREDSIFRSLCDEAHLMREDIVRIRAGVTRPEEVAVVPV